MIDIIVAVILAAYLDINSSGHFSCINISSFEGLFLRFLKTKTKKMKGKNYFFF